MSKSDKFSPNVHERPTQLWASGFKCICALQSRLQVAVGQLLTATHQPVTAVAV